MTLRLHLPAKSPYLHLSLLTRQKPAAPPIYIRNINNFYAFKDVLIKTVGPKGFTCKSTPSYLIVRPNGHVNFNLLSNYLLGTNASFHTFCPHYQRPLSIVIRNLHHSTLSAVISSALSEGHLVRNVHNVKKFFFFLTSNPILIINISTTSLYY
jgi:hypothetical protein